MSDSTSGRRSVAPPAHPAAPARRSAAPHPYPTAPAAPLVEAVGLEKRYTNGVEGLRGVGLHVAPGEMVGLLGPSGSGKTTLLRLVGLALWPTAGTLRVLGQDVAALRGARLRAMRRRIATIAQQHSLVPRASVQHNVLLGRAGHAPLWRSMLSAFQPTPAGRAAAFGVLAELGIGHTLDRPVDSLSGGQQQRVAVARALLHGGELLLADEPVASVDQETAELILALLRRSAVQDGRAVLVSLHQRPLALRFCTRLVALGRGQILYDGPPDRDAWRAEAAAHEGGASARPAGAAGRGGGDSDRFAGAAPSGDHPLERGPIEPPVAVAPVGMT